MMNDVVFPVSIGVICQIVCADAGLANVRQHNVEYVLESRHIRPIRRAGQANLYDRRAVERVKRVLKEIQARKGEVGKELARG
jgi:hypothetical protein